MSEKRRWRKMVGRYDFGKPKSPLFVTEYLKDGKILKTVHDGSFSPGGEEPYTPVPWMRLRGDSHVADGETLSGGSVIVVYGMYSSLPRLEYSTDGETWQQAELTEQEMGETTAAITDSFDLDEGEELWLRAAEPTDSMMALIIPDGALYADGNAYALFSQQDEDWVKIRPVGFMPPYNMGTGDSRYAGLTHLPDLPAYEDQAIEGYDGMTAAGLFLEGAFSKLYDDIVMSDDGRNFNFRFGMPFGLFCDVIEQISEMEVSAPAWDFSTAVVLSLMVQGTLTTGFTSTMAIFVEMGKATIPASSLAGQLAHNGEGFVFGAYDALVFRDGEEASLEITQDGEGLPVAVVVGDPETQTTENVPLVNGKFSIAGLPSPAAAIGLSMTLPPYTAKVLSSTSLDGELDAINTLVGVSAVNYQSLDYGDYTQSRANVETHTMMLYTQEHGKTVDIAIADPYTPLAFYKSTDNGSTWTALQPASTAPSSTANTTVYSFAAADGDIIKIVRSSTKTVTVVTTTPEDSTYADWSGRKDSIYPENYLTKTYRGSGGESKAALPEYYLDITTGVTKTVDMYIHPDYAPLTFKKSTDNGSTWSDIQAASVSQNVYSFSLDDGEWLNIVRGGGTGPK